MQKETVEKTIKYFCFKYIYFNLFILLFTLYQFENIPIALPLILSIISELITMFLFTKGQKRKMIDHILHISLYIYLIVVYYLQKNAYIFCNIFMVISFLLNIDCKKKPEIQQEISSTIRLSKLFYHFTFLIAVLCVTLKLSNIVNWSWAQTFWWYWMIESGLVGATLTILMILISKVITINSLIDEQKQEIKTLLWGLYITLFSSIIAGIWVINTFNILHVNVIVEIGDIILIIICSFNILIFPLITRFIFKDIVEYIMSFNQIQDNESSPNTPNTPNIQEKNKQLQKIPTKAQVFLKKLSNAYFKQIKNPEILILKYQNQNEIETERNVSHKIIIKQQETQQQQQQSQNKCLICFENQANAVLMNCGHGGLCYQCAMQLAQKSKECFLCRENIKEIYEIIDKDCSMLKRVISKTRISM